MILSAASYGAGFLAGVVTPLSPCVLPLLPIVLASSVSAHRLGAAALAGGLAVSFAIVGIFVATIGFAIGLDTNLFRLGGAILLTGFGVLQMSDGLQERLALALSPLGARASAAADRVSPNGLGGQALVGLLLGLVWTPCVGPTLGAAATLAAQRHNLWEVSFVMLLFAFGAALPLVLIGTLGREALLLWRGPMLRAGKIGKRLLGAGMIALALAIFTGLDRHLETALTAMSPAWLTDITTRY